jgi:hypothetical protein
MALWRSLVTAELRSSLTSLGRFMRIALLSGLIRTVADQQHQYFCVPQHSFFCIEWDYGRFCLIYG